MPHEDVIAHQLGARQARTPEQRPGIRATGGRLLGLNHLKTRSHRNSTQVNARHRAASRGGDVRHRKATHVVLRVVNVCRKKIADDNNTRESIATDSPFRLLQQQYNHCQHV